MLAIVFALACAVSYGSADFLGGIASRRAPLYGVVVYSQAAGLLALVVALPLLGAGGADGRSLGFGALAGLLGGAGILLLYAALAAGRMAVVSPVTAGLVAAVPALWGIFRGEHPSLLTSLGLASVVGAVLLVSISPGGAPEPGRPGRFAIPGLPEALGSGVFLGAGLIALASIGHEAGFVPLAVTRATAIALVLLAAAVGRRPIAVGGPPLLTVAACGLLDVAANVFFLLATRNGMLSVVAVLASLYPASTVALAWIVLRERMIATQWAGVALAIFGIVMIAARS